jgi:hypothetical protein
MRPYSPAAATAVLVNYRKVQSCLLNSTGGAVQTSYQKVEIMKTQRFTLPAGCGAVLAVVLASSSLHLHVAPSGVVMELKVGPTSQSNPTKVQEVAQPSPATAQEAVTKPNPPKAQEVAGLL